LGCHTGDHWVVIGVIIEIGRWGSIERKTSLGGRSFTTAQQHPAPRFLAGISFAKVCRNRYRLCKEFCSGVAEFQRDLIRERTGAARQAAKQHGVRFGRSRKRNTDQAALASQLSAEGKAIPEIARTFKFHNATIYRLQVAQLRNR